MPRAEERIGEELNGEPLEAFLGIATTLVPIALPWFRVPQCGIVVHDETPYGAARTAPEPLLTIDGLARLLAVDRKTVYRLPIPFVVVGTRRRYRREDVDRYLERDREPV